MHYTHRVVDERDLSIKLEGSFEDCLAFKERVSEYSSNAFAYWVYTIDKHEDMIKQRRKETKGGAYGLCDE